MKLFFQYSILIVLCCNFNLLISQDLIFEWKKEISATGRGKGNSIATDSDNNSYIVGQFDKEIEINNETFISNGTKDGILMKIDASGNYLWIKEFKSYKNVNITSIALDDNEDIFIVGSYHDSVQFDTTLFTIHPGGTTGSTMFISKFNKNGELIWASNTGGIYYDYNSLTINSEGDILISAKAITIDQFGNNILNISPDSIWVNWYPTDPYWLYFYQEYSIIAKYTNSGDFIWCKQSGGDPRDIIIDNNDNIILAGAIYALPLFIYGDDNVFYGDSLIIPTGTVTIFLSKYNSNGEFQWLELAGGSDNNNYGSALEVDSENNIYLTGQIGGSHITFGGDIISPNSTFHAFIAKYSTFGNVLWVKDIGSPDNLDGETNHNGGTSLKINSLNELIFSGFFKDSLLIAGKTIVSDGGSDMMIIKLNLNGDFLDIGQYVRYGWTNACDISIGSNDEIFLTGFIDESNSALPSQILIGKIGGNLPTPIMEIKYEENFNIYPAPAKIDQNITIEFKNKPQYPSKLLISDLKGNLINSTILNDRIFNFKINKTGYFIISIVENDNAISKGIIIVE